MDPSWVRSGDSFCWVDIQISGWQECKKSAQESLQRLRGEDVKPEEFTTNGTSSFCGLEWERLDNRKYIVTTTGTHNLHF